MRLTKKFFQRDVLEVAPDLIGKILVRRFENGKVRRFMITEVEAYRGEEDLACHASKGRTKRTEVMYGEGGKIYVYLIYGMYFLLNFVTNHEGAPQAVLIRGIREIEDLSLPSRSGIASVRRTEIRNDEVVGSGKVGKVLEIDKSFYGENIYIDSGSMPGMTRMWLEHDEIALDNRKIEKLKRVGVDYAGEWAEKLWRFKLS